MGELSAANREFGTKRMVRAKTVIERVFIRSDFFQKSQSVGENTQHNKIQLYESMERGAKEKTESDGLDNKEADSRKIHSIRPTRPLLICTEYASVVFGRLDSILF